MKRIKIKESVDLKILEEYGFKFNGNDYSSNYGVCRYTTENYRLIINNDKVITMITVAGSIFDLEIIYKLIRDNLVELKDEID